MLQNAREFSGDFSMKIMPSVNLDMGYLFGVENASGVVNGGNVLGISRDLETGVNTLSPKHRHSISLKPSYSPTEKIDFSLIEAGRDLGLSRFEVFWKITFPLSLPGVIGAILIIFIPTVGDYVTPALLGGTDGRMLSNMIQAYFGKANNIPLGAASATIMLTTVALITIVVSNVTKRLTQRLS